MKLRTLVRAPALTQSGYGVHARQVIYALMNQPEKYDLYFESIQWGGCPFVTHDTPGTDALKRLNSRYQQAKAQGQDQDWDLFVSISIPNEFERRGKLNVGITAGIETDRVSNEWLQRCNLMDMIIVPSEHSKRSFVSSQYNWTNQQTGEQGILRLERPVHVVPEGFDPQVFKPRKEIHTQAIKDLSFPTKFNFLCVGLWGPGGYGDDRKNIANTILWFFEAFQNRKDVGLVLKVSMAKNSAVDYEATLKRIKQIKANFPEGSTPPVYLVHGALTDENMGELYCHPQIDAFLSLTQGEGFGLPLLEAAASKLPIIATNWSGHLDFLGKKLFSAVNYDLKPIPEAAVWDGVLVRGSQWAHPDKSDAIRRMQQAVANRSKPKQWAETLHDEVQGKFNLAATQRKLLQTVDTFVQSNALQTGKPEAVKAHFEAIIQDPDAYNILYTMPMSAGDVFLSTAVIDSVVKEAKKANDNVNLFFATQDAYAPILENNPHVTAVVPWNESMLNISALEEVFDLVLTPNVPTQFVFSNWVRGGNGRLLVEEFANHCQSDIGEFHIKRDDSVFSHVLADHKGLDLRRTPYMTFHPGSGKGQHEARKYVEWQEVITNLKLSIPELKIVQVGAADEPSYKEIDVDLRGKTTVHQLASVIDKSKFHLSIDTFSMHLAAAAEVPLLALFGSSHANSTGPWYRDRENAKFVLLEAQQKMGCKNACYKYQCKVNREMPCINEVSAAEITQYSTKLLSDTFEAKTHEFQHIFPPISGYTTSYNAMTMGYPFIESISSMLGFCDEVVIVDHSTDGTYELLEKMAADEPRISLYQREWEKDNPTQDGDAKAFARALCTGDYCWQQDLDEVVHEKDYERIKWIAKRFPQSDILHLPVIEVWGDADHVTGRRHCWKWRMSRNLPHISHGVNKHARITDPKTGVVYAKEGMSDSCEYIDLVSLEPLSHVGFYNAEIEQARVQHPEEYARICNLVFDKIPSLYHYSWADLPLKVRQFQENWDRQWSVLYQKKNDERFPEAKTVSGLNALVDKLYKEGGEDSDSVKYKFKLEHSHPAVMKDWLEAAHTMKETG